jgi:hypothetical protein
LKGDKTMTVFSKRNLLVAIATFVIGVGACAAIWGVPKFVRRSTSVNSQVTAYLLDDRGDVNGLLLASGDQLHFSKQTGAIVAAQIKVGDEVTASGHAGSKSSYGREVRVDKISANGRTIVEAEAGPPRPHGPHDERGPRNREGRSDRPGPPEPRSQGSEPPVGAAAPPVEPNRSSGSDPKVAPAANAGPVPAAPAMPEVFKAAGTIRTHLVNGHGDVDGLVLSSGEQVRFSPKVGELIIAAEQGTTTQVSVEGNGVRNDHGTVIRPTQITLGNQTIALGR